LCRRGLVAVKAAEVVFETFRPLYAVPGLLVVRQACFSLALLTEGSTSSVR